MNKLSAKNRENNALKKKWQIVRKDNRRLNLENMELQEHEKEVTMTSDRKSEYVPSAILPPPHDSFEHNTMAEESFSIVDGFKIIEVSANTENNVPDGIRKHALFRPGNQRGEGKSGENCQRPRKRSRTVQEAWILRKKKYRKRIVRSK